jgi:uncharacterized protein with PQ loop repeat
VRTCSAILILVFYFLAPLSTLWQVIRQRDSSSLVLPLSVMVIINGSLWSTYGIVALNDPFVWAPNVFGATLGVVQVFLKLTIPSHPNQCAPIFIDVSEVLLLFCFRMHAVLLLSCFSMHAALLLTLMQDRAPVLQQRACIGSDSKLSYALGSDRKICELTSLVHKTFAISKQTRDSLGMHMGSHIST